MLGFKYETVLKTKNAVVRAAHDTVTNTYSVGLTTDKGATFKMIDKETYDVLAVIANTRSEDE